MTWYNQYLVKDSRLEPILALPEGVGRTAAMAAWVQSLYPSEPPPPVLVGGAAAELLTGCVYTSGDLDFIGRVPDGVASTLAAAGFQRHGRHWVHPAGQVLIEFAGENLEEFEEGVTLEVAGSTVEVLSPEAALVDRLAAWHSWESSADGVKAYLLWRVRREQMDRAKLMELIRRNKLERAWTSLLAFTDRSRGAEPTTEELQSWAGNVDF